MFPLGGDTIVTLDLVNNRALIYDSAGTVVGSHGVPKSRLPVGAQWLPELRLVYAGSE